MGVERPPDGKRRRRHNRHNRDRGSGGDRRARRGDIGAPRGSGAATPGGGGHHSHRHQLHQLHQLAALDATALSVWEARLGVSCPSAAAASERPRLVDVGSALWGEWLWGCNPCEVFSLPPPPACCPRATHAHAQLLLLHPR